MRLFGRFVEKRVENSAHSFFCDQSPVSFLPPCMMKIQKKEEKESNKFKASEETETSK